MVSITKILISKLLLLLLLLCEHFRTLDAIKKPKKVANDKNRDSSGQENLGASISTSSMITNSINKNGNYAVVTLLMGANTGYATGAVLLRSYNRRILCYKLICLAKGIKKFGN